MSKQKKQGTAHESWLVKRQNDFGYRSRRLAEGGTRDEGDVEAWLPDRWVLEAKARSSLNIQKTLGDARRKAEQAAGEPVPVAVVWKRLVRVDGLQVRQPVNGERVVISMSLDDFLALLNRKEVNTSE